MSIARRGSSTFSISLASRFASFGPVAGLARQPLQVRDHVLVGRIDAQRAAVDVERRVLVRQPPLLDLGDAATAARRCASASSLFAAITS